MYTVVYDKGVLLVSFLASILFVGAIYGSIAAAFMTPAPQPKPNIIQALGLVRTYTILLGKYFLISLNLIIANNNNNDNDNNYVLMAVIKRLYDSNSTTN